LNISVKTVEVHKTNGMRKLDLPDRSALVRHAAMHGCLLEPWHPRPLGSFPCGRRIAVVDLPFAIEAHQSSVRPVENICRPGSVCCALAIAFRCATGSRINVWSGKPPQAPASGSPPGPYSTAGYRRSFWTSPWRSVSTVPARGCRQHDVCLRGTHSLGRVCSRVCPN